MRWPTPVIALALAACIACGGGASDDEAAAEVERFLLGVVADWNAADGDAFTAAFTDDGISELFGADPADATLVREQVAGLTGLAPLGNPAVSDVEVDGDDASATLFLDSQGMREGDRVTLVREGDGWLIDGFDSLAVPVDIPDGYGTVAITMREFTYDVDTAAITASRVAFEVRNDGDQPHEAALAAVAPGADLEQELAAAAEGEDEGLRIVAVLELQPGESYNMLLTEDLVPGRYAFFCSLPDLDEGDDGAPHSTKGMFTEFNIE